MECNRQNVLSLWTVFCPFTPLQTQKVKILKKWKKALEDIIILQMFTINDSHITYGFQMWSAIDKIFRHFGPFFALLPSLFHVKITASVTKSLHQVRGPCNLHLPIFLLYMHSPLQLANKKLL